MELNQSQYNLVDALESEQDKGMNADHPQWNISITKQVLEILRDSIKAEDVSYLAEQAFGNQYDAVGRSVWLGSIEELNDFAGDADV